MGWHLRTVDYGIYVFSYLCILVFSLLYNLLTLNVGNELLGVGKLSREVPIVGIYLFPYLLITFPMYVGGWVGVDFWR